LAFQTQSPVVFATFLVSWNQVQGHITLKTENTMGISNETLNAQEAADFLGAHVETIRRMARRGTIPAFKIGKDWRFNKASVLTWSKTNPGINNQRAILVIDDDAAVRRLMRRYLEPMGHLVLTAPTGVEGLAYLDSHSIDLVLLDLQMPVMSGPVFIRELRRAGMHTPVIIVTGYPDSTMMLEASRYGPLMLVPKPIEPEVLLSAVRMTFEGSKAERALA
jgi:excisionase family DNA binding protein